jgi:glycerol kinase
MAKNTYGTGSFVLANVGPTCPPPAEGLLTSVGWTMADGSVTYVLEGSIFITGAAVQWLRDELRVIDSAGEVEALAQSVADTGGVYIVPAFTGLGAPWWAPDARGSIFGITRGTGQAQLVRAALEAIAYQVSDLAVAMEADAGKPIEVLNVDGGASANNFLIQFQSDILERTLHRPQNRETTAMGAAYLAGLATGFWSGIDELRSLRSSDDVFTPKMDAEKRAELLDGWHEAIRRTI